jgi:Flp pilus assembly protein TadD
VQLDPKSIDAILTLTAVQLALGSVDQAEVSYRNAIQQAPTDVRPYIMLGSLEETQGKWQEAQDLYQRALGLQADNAAAANNLAYLMLTHGGNVDVALTFAQTARRAKPDVPNTADTLAWAYIQKGVYGSAVDLLQEAVQQAPTNPTYHYHLGIAYQKNKDDANAKIQFERALQLNPQPAQESEIRQQLAAVGGA